MLRCLRAIQTNMSPKISAAASREPLTVQNIALMKKSSHDLIVSLRALLHSLWQTNSEKEFSGPLAAQILQKLYVLLLNLAYFRGSSSAQRRSIRLIVPALMKELSDGVLPPVWLQNFSGQFSGYDDRSFGGSATVLAPALSLLASLGDSVTIESNIAALQRWICEEKTLNPGANEVELSSTCMLIVATALLPCAQKLSNSATRRQIFGMMFATFMRWIDKAELRCGTGGSRRKQVGEMNSYEYSLLPYLVGRLFQRHIPVTGKPTSTIVIEPNGVPGRSMFSVLSRVRFESSPKLHAPLSKRQFLAVVAFAGVRRLLLHDATNLPLDSLASREERAQLLRYCLHLLHQAAMLLHHYPSPITPLGPADPQARAFLLKTLRPVFIPSPKPDPKQMTGPNAVTPGVSQRYEKFTASLTSPPPNPPPAATSSPFQRLVATIMSPTGGATPSPGIPHTPRVSADGLPSLHSTANVSVPDVRRGTAGKFNLLVAICKLKIYIYIHMYMYMYTYIAYKSSYGYLIYPIHISTHQTTPGCAPRPWRVRASLSKRLQLTRC